MKRINCGAFSPGADSHLTLPTAWHTRCLSVKYILIMKKLINRSMNNKISVK